jgi:hypothetical protein
MLSRSAMQAENIGLFTVRKGTAQVFMPATKKTRQKPDLLAELFPFHVPYDNKISFFFCYSFLFSIINCIVAPRIS